MHDEGRRDAAFVDPVLVEPERRIRQIGPGGTVALIGVLAARHQRRIVAEANRLALASFGLGDHQLIDEFSRGDALGNVFGTGAVVRQEDEQRIVELAGLFERSDDAADALVHAVDLRGIDLHAAQRPLAVLGFSPRWLGRIAVGQLPVRMNDAVVDQAFQPLLAQFVPARVEPALVFGDVLVMRMQRPVWRRVGDVLKERRVGVGSACVAGYRPPPDR